MDPATLATTVVTGFLLPYMKQAAIKVGDALAKKAAGSAAEGLSGAAASLLKRVKDGFSSPDDKAVVTQFERRPDEASKLLESVLRERLQTDPALAQDLLRIVTEARSASSSSGAKIEDATTAGIADARYANFSGAQGVTITGVTVPGPAVPDETKRGK